MIIYLALFFSILATYVFFQTKVYRSTIFFVLGFGILALFVGLSDMLGGYDRYIYGELFDNTADFLRNGGHYVDSIVFLQYPKEIGYVFANILISEFSSNRYIFILCLTVLIYILFFVSFKRHVSNYPLGMILFMGLLFFFTFTYLRQIIAVSIGSLAIKYVIDRKLWKFLLCVLVAFSFHNSAIVLLPLYFIPIRKYNISTILLILFVCLVFGATGFSNTLFGAFGDMTDTEGRTAGYENEIGFRIAYILEAVFFLFFLLRGHSRIPNDRQQLVLYNMAIIFCAILLFFVKSENGGRISWYYIIGLIASLCYLLDSSINSKSDKLLIVLVSSFLYLRILLVWGGFLYPYKSFLSNGVRENDAIYEKYEYDNNYASDKFYRK